MAKFLPTVNLWNAAIETALRNGQLKLQRGQWVQCGTFADGSGCKSRFLEVVPESGTIRCIHGGSIKEVNDRFYSIVKAYKDTESRMYQIKQRRLERQQQKQVAA